MRSRGDGSRTRYPRCWHAQSAHRIHQRRRRRHAARRRRRPRTSMPFPKRSDECSDGPGSCPGRRSASIGGGRVVGYQSRRPGAGLAEVDCAPAEGTRWDRDVGIEKQQHVSSRSGGAEVAGNRRTLSAARLKRPKSGRTGRCGTATAAAVVDNDDVIGRRRKGAERREAPIERRSRNMCGNDDGHFHLRRRLYRPDAVPACYRQNRPV